MSHGVRHALAVAVVAAVFAVVPAQDPTQRRGFSVRITEPANQEIVFGKTRIVAQVRADSPEVIDRVEFYVGDELIFVDREPPWECQHDFGETSRSWVVRAVAHHVEEVSVSDAVITRRVVAAFVEEVNRVILWATVTDKKDRLVTGLSREEFEVYEDGERQRILDFYPEDRPITLAILLDSSGSMHEKIDEVHEAASSFVDALRDEDHALVIDFDDKVFLIQELTSNKPDLKETIESTKAIGATALYDAMHAAFRKLRGIDGRKAIVLLSDGEDTASQFSYGRVLEEAKANNVIIYGIGLGGGDRRVVKEFPRVTGGRAFFVDKASELEDVYQKIAEELRSQYYLTYSTSNETWDGRWIELDVRVPDTPYKARARRGFFAVRGSMLEGG